MTRVYIGLGSNVDPEGNLVSAARMLRNRWPGIRFSHVYRTDPREVEDQPKFLNAAAAFEADEEPQAIAAALRSIERTLKKHPPYRFGPRTIDIDLLLYGNEILPSEEEWLQGERTTPATGNLTLVIPHLRMHRRRFVLEPLCELIDPSLHHPVLHETWTALLATTGNQDCRFAEMSLNDFCAES